MKNINKIIAKVWKYFFALIITSVFYGCVDLEEDPFEDRLAPGEIGNVFDLEALSNGMYGKLQFSAQFNTIFAPAWGADDITTHRASNKQDFRAFDRRVVTEGNGRTNNMWEQLYGTIFAATNLIENSEGVSIEDNDLRDRRIAEALFVRSAMFLQLLRTYEEIPFPLSTEGDIDITTTPRVTIYEQLERDLLRAASLLPDIQPSEGGSESISKMRPNKGSARALLTRMYMDWAGFPTNDTSKYADAEATAKLIIDNSDKHGFSLLDNLEELWMVSNRFNDESVWSIVFCEACGIGNLKYGRLGLPTDLSGWQETLAEVKFFEEFPEGARKEATYRTDLNWQNFTDQKNPVFKKITGPDNDFDVSLEDGIPFSTDRSDFIIRYADVLLMYAEASAEAGTATAEAWEALNQVRRRAAGLPYSTPVPALTNQLNADGTPNTRVPQYVDITSGDLAELAFEERKLEFAGEWVRWYDLVRKERVNEAIGGGIRQTGSLPESNTIVGSTGTENYFAPFPINQIINLPGISN